MKISHISLAFVGLTWVVPFLYAPHHYPITTFYAEWIAALLGCFSMMLFVAKRFWEFPEVPRVILLPTGMIAIVLLQYFMGKIPYFGQALLFCLYLLWAALMAVVGRSLRQIFGLDRLAIVLASCLLLGGELSALAGLIQRYHWHTFFAQFVMVERFAAVYGNLAQPNHFADYVSLGLVSLGLIHFRLSWRKWLVALLALPLLFVLVLSGSRSAWLYLVSTASIGWLFRRKDKAYAQLATYGLSLLFGFFFMNLVVQIPWFSVTEDHVTSGGRLLTQAVNGNIRLHLWHEAWRIFILHSFFGAGFGQYGWQHFSLGPALRDPLIVGPVGNAHDIVMQLAAETGVAGLLLFFWTAFSWIRQLFYRKASADLWWAYAVLAVLSLHSFVEYPLWYAYFLGLFATLAGMLDDTSWKIGLRRPVAASMLILGGLSLYQMIADYRGVEEAIVKRRGEQLISFSEREKSELLQVGQYSIMHPYAELALTPMIEINSDHLAEKLRLNGDVFRFHPIPSVAYRQAKLLALSGNEAQAGKVMSMAIWSYPESFPEERKQLMALAKQYPGQFSALVSKADEEYGKRFRIDSQH